MERHKTWTEELVAFMWVLTESSAASTSRTPTTYFARSRSKQELPKAVVLFSKVPACCAMALADWISADDVGGDSQVKRHKIVQQAHVIYLVRPLFVLFRERIEDFPNCRAPEVFYQVYSPPYVTH